MWHFSFKESEREKKNEPTKQQSLPHCVALFSSFSCPSVKPLQQHKQTITLDRQARIPLYLPPSLACRLKRAIHNPDTSSLCKWKRKYGGDWSVKNPLSPPSLSLRQEWHCSDNNNNKDSDEPHRRIIHEPQKQHQRSSVSPKNSLTQQPAERFQSRPVHELQPETFTLREDISLSMAPTWSEEGALPRWGFGNQRAYSPTCLKSLQFVTSGALLPNKITLCATWNGTKHRLRHQAAGGYAPHP